MLKWSFSFLPETLPDSGIRILKTGAIVSGFWNPDEERILESGPRAVWNSDEEWSYQPSGRVTKPLDTLPDSRDFFSNDCTVTIVLIGTTSVVIFIVILLFLRESLSVLLY